MSSEPDTAARRDGMYLADCGRMFWIKPKVAGEKEEPITLANFDARIVSDVVCDDGAETSRAFEIEAVLNAGTSRFRVPASKFGSLNWIAEHVGAQAYVTAAQGSERKLREAITRLSGKIARRTVYAHTGWTRRGEEWIYLHADGAIGANGIVPGIEVELPGALANFKLPAPLEGESLHEGITAAIALIDLAPHRITAPLFCATWRAVLGPADFAIALAGRTGNFKTELAALAMQHFGPGFAARHLPGSWSSTANFLRSLTFVAKDAPIVVDDFVPTGSRVDISRQHRDASALLRDCGNAAGRGRLASDASMRPIRMPRGLVISTGEENFRGESLQGRLLTIEVARGDVSNLTKLTEAQNRAAEGLCAGAMSTYLHWLAPRLDDVRSELKQTRPALRTKAAEAGGHARTPALVADLYSGATIFFRFAVESEALPQYLADTFLSQIWEGLIEAADQQAEHVRNDEPCARFLTLLRAAIASGAAHLADVDGGRPVDSQTCGWRLEEFRGRVSDGDERLTGRFQPMGACVGWIDCDDIYLNCDVALKAANSVATDGTGLSIPGAVLRKRLKEKMMLASTGTDRGRSTITILKTVAGARLEVLHFARETVLPIAKTDATNDQTQTVSKEI